MFQIRRGLSASLLAFLLTACPHQGSGDTPGNPDPGSDVDPWLVPTIARSCSQFCTHAGAECRKRSREDCPTLAKQCMASCFDVDKLKGAAAAGIPERWGSTKETAINTCMAEGVKQFMADLRCQSGDQPTFRKSRTVGTRNPIPDGETPADWIVPMKAEELDSHLVDLYELRCGKRSSIIFFDPYHCADGPQPWVAPEGFTRSVPPPDAITKKLRSMGVGSRQLIKQAPAPQEPARTVPVSQPAPVEPAPAE